MMMFGVVRKEESLACRLCMFNLTIIHAACMSETEWHGDVVARVHVCEVQCSWNMRTIKTELVDMREVAKWGHGDMCMGGAQRWTRLQLPTLGRECVAHWQWRAGSPRLAVASVRRKHRVSATKKWKGGSWEKATEETNLMYRGCHVVCYVTDGMCSFSIKANRGSDGGEGISWDVKVSPYCTVQ